MDLIGKKFGKLTVISKADSILGGEKNKRYWGAWNCKCDCDCDCDNTIIVKTVHLNNGSVKSCGCLISQYGISIKPDQKFNRLTTISYKNGKWICVCECGKYIEVYTDKLNNNNTKSCGCLKTEESSKRSYKLINSRRKFEPKIASARRIWKNYYYRDSECINFDEFFEKSQQNCFYCDVSPNTKYNYFNTKSSNSSEFAKNNGLFIYNGLDRIDSSKNHTIDNIVTCCYNCNRAKNNRNINDFLLWINNLKIKQNYNLKIDNISLPINGSILTSIKCIYKPGYNDGDLSIEEFYSISQMPCFYCSTLPLNFFNKAKTDKKASQQAKDYGNFVYNGLDRINPNFSHNKNNIVPCCKYCNFAKSKLTLNEFYEWIKRVQDYQNKDAILSHV